ncbi:hypothetical protein HAX54_036940 [Datura stramonium]|uniref:Uncharacterized protein n=1 Tax=Datura stramonium TaxID=4076 RepID=A0ABS8VHJ8_DATST|nr:hypothetical protein [Datura stramonium]
MNLVVVRVGVIASKGKEVVIAQPRLKRLHIGPKGASSSAVEAGSSRRFGAKAVEPHGLTWFNSQKEAMYAPKNWIDNDRFVLVLKLPTIRDKLRELGVGYIIVEPGE